MRHLPAISIYVFMVMWAADRFSVMGVRVGVANLFLGQSIGVDETNTISLNIFF